VKLTDFSLLTDENIHADVVKHLRTLGFDVKDVREEQLHGATDKQLLEIAYLENRVIVTHDSDFGTFIFTENTNFHGITYFRPGHIISTFVINSIDALINLNPDIQLPFIIVVENHDSKIKIRIRQFN
jgi:predicted nuclease of predicted toxin-antitoxin system